MNVQRQIDRLIAHQAAEWYETLKNADAAEHAAFTRWVSESPRHIEAFLAISSEAAVVRKVLTSGEFDLESLLKEVSGGEKVLPLRPEGSAVAAARRGRSRGRSPLLYWAAALLAAMAIMLPIQRSLSGWERFETPVGEQRTIQLMEGSIVNLNAQSRVEVRFSDSQRELRLPRGEATFKVAHDASRPFRVHTPGATVEAVGTQFNVYARPDGSTQIAVLEGKVKVSEANSSVIGAGSQPSEAVPVAAGEEAQVASSGNIELRPNPNVAEAVAWQQRKLIFKRTALDEIAAEFNRYNKFAQIRLEGIQPGTLRFSGAFDADDPQSLATLLMREPDLFVDNRGEEIIIRRR